VSSEPVSTIPSPMPTAVVSVNRLEAFSDGVFAIAITLLVLELRPPTTLPLAPQLRAMIPQIGAYAAAFLVVGMAWIGHHGLFHLLRRMNKTLIWLNMGLLLCISFVPFPTMVLGLDPLDPVAIRLFALTMVMAGWFYNAMWAYASGGHRLIKQDLSPALIQLMWWRNIAFPLAYGTAFLMTFWKPVLGLVILALVPAGFMLPSRFDAREYRAKS
jgi:uncharacterized membrane protein